MIILYEDNHLIAVDKPAGILVHGDKTGDKTLADHVKQYIKEKYNKPGDVFLGSVHRIDRPTSGIVIFARTSKALVRMNKLVADREITKRYIAVTENAPPESEQTLTHFILKRTDKNRVHCYDTRKHKAKLAVLNYRFVSHIAGRYVLLVDLKTGRPHQIRAQLSKVGCSIIGDVKYGATNPFSDWSIALHAYSLSFVHPVKKEPITINCLPPKVEPFNLFDWEELLNYE